MAEDVTNTASQTAEMIAARVEQFVRGVVVAYELDPRCGLHGPSEDLVGELRVKAKEAGILTPHLPGNGVHFNQRQTAIILKRSGLSPLGPVALNTAAPDEGNMYLLEKVCTDEQKAKFLRPLIEGRSRSAFLMTEPASDNGAGSDPSMLQTSARLQGDAWIINGRKTLITGVKGARVGIVMAKADAGACLFLVDLPDTGLVIERVLDTLDSSMPGGHAVVALKDLHVPASQLLGAPGRGFELAQIRLSPARLSHCMRWFGAAARAHEIATEYACTRMAFGKLLIDHEGVGFQLADNLIELRQVELMIDWCADVLDSGSLGVTESSMTKTAVSEALFRVADRCVQIMGGTGVSRDTIVEQVFREIRSFRIYDGPTEVHKWSLAKSIKRQWLAQKER